MDQEIPNPYEIQQEAQRLIKNTGLFPKVPKCNRETFVKGSNIALVKYYGASKASTYGFKKCNNMWLCPVCHYKILRKETQKINHLVSTWRKKGKALVFVTFRVRSHKGNDFTETFDKFMKLFDTPRRKALVYKAIETDFNIKAEIRSIEISYSMESGFGPHFHNIYFLDLAEDKATDDFVTALEARMSAYFTGACKAVGLDKPNEQAAVKALKVQSPQDADQDVGNYINKPRFVRPGNAGIMSPLDFPLYSLRGDRKFSKLFEVYARAVKGTAYGKPRKRSHRKVFYSKGIYKLLNITKQATPQRTCDMEMIADLRESHRRAIAKDPVLRVKFENAGLESQEQVDRFFEEHLSWLAPEPSE